ncbi:MAG: sel1 repeat family protein [Desulfovibrio sp.]|nr:sel1 repeat family protein [Desulfovibrio sp.]
MPSSWDPGLRIHGPPRPQDYAEARRWYGKAAAQGHARAQFNMGFMCEKGQDIPQDKRIAKDWFRKACNGGDEHACDAYRHLNATGF